MIHPQRQRYSACYALIFMGLLPFLCSAKYTAQPVCTLDVLIKAKDEPLPKPDLPSHQILGEIVVLGQPVPGVLIQADNQGETCITDEMGHYSLEVPWGWSGQVTPSKEGWVFDPPCRSYHNVTRDINERTTPQSMPVPEWPGHNHRQAEATDSELDDSLLPAAPPSWGRLAVTPMVISLEGQPGQTLETTLSIQNMGIQSPQVTLSLANLVQQSNGPWRPQEPDPAQPPTHSCREWLNLKSSNQMFANLSRMGTATCPLEIKIPFQARGFYSAALLVRPNPQDGVTSPVNCTLVIPVLVEVDIDQAEVDVEITHLELIVPFTTDPTQVPRVRLTVDNQGETLCCLNASVSAKPSDRAQTASTEPTMQFKRQWIMPGTRLSLETKYIGPRPDQALTLCGLLDLVQEQRWIQMIGTASPKVLQRSEAFALSLTDDPTRTMAMLDYNESQKIHMDPCEPYSVHQFLGHGRLGMATNFPAHIQPVVQEVIPGSATWSASVRPACIQGPTNVLLTVQATDLAMEKLPGGRRNLVAARLGVLVIPEIGRWQR